MSKRFLRAALAIIAAALWGASLLFQHVACFDVFDTNAGYLYLLAVLFAALQGVILFLAQRRCLFGKLFIMFAAAYAVLAVCLAVQLLVSGYYDPYPLGLTVLCLSLDVVGTAWVFTSCRRESGKA